MLLNMTQYTFVFISCFQISDLHVGCCSFVPQSLCVLEVSCGLCSCDKRSVLIALFKTVQEDILSVLLMCYRVRQKTVFGSIS